MVLRLLQAAMTVTRAQLVLMILVMLMLVLMLMVPLARLTPLSRRHSLLVLDSEPQPAHLLVQSLLQVLVVQPPFRP